jgi:uncharacterized protein YjlB
MPVAVSFYSDRFIPEKVEMTAPSKSEINSLVRVPDVAAKRLRSEAAFPNSRLPLLIYTKAIVLAGNDPAAVVEKVFEANGWCGSWRNGIYPYHHYHSTAHEVLGVYCGSAMVQFGGDNGVVVELEAGDLVVIPAGVAHKNLGAPQEFGVVGAYPQGQDWDMNYGKPGERPKADENISKVPLPKTDPVYGSAGPLLGLWSATR